jgi:hypothetical protein
MGILESDCAPYNELGKLADKLLLKRDNTYNRAIDAILENNLDKYNKMILAAKNTQKEFIAALKGLNKKIDSGFVKMYLNICDSKN